MTSYKKASDLVGKGQSASAVFTRGRNFRIDRDGGSTGNWRLNPRRAERADWIVVYLRGKGGCALWRGRNAGLSKRGQRHKVKLAELQLVGYTDANWHQFSGGRKEVRYLTR
jgi:hypothetical protein